MFDNEIDWVMRIRHDSLVPAAARQLAGFNAWMTQYKAEHIAKPQQCGVSKCSM
jgi:hypothetical protein